MYKKQWQGCVTAQGHRQRPQTSERPLCCQAGSGGLGGGSHGAFQLLWEEDAPPPPEVVQHERTKHGAQMQDGPGLVGQGAGRDLIHCMAWLFQVKNHFQWPSSYSSCPAVWVPPAPRPPVGSLAWPCLARGPPPARCSCPSHHTPPICEPSPRRAP